MSFDVPLPTTQAYSESIPSDIQPALMPDDTYDEQMHANRSHQPFTLPESLPDHLVEFPNRATEFPDLTYVGAHPSRYSSVLLEPPVNTQSDIKYAEAERRLCEILIGIRDPIVPEPTPKFQSNSNAEAQPKHPTPPPAFLQPSIDPHPNNRVAEAERRFRELYSRGRNSISMTPEPATEFPGQDFQVRKPTGNLLGEIRQKHFPTAAKGVAKSP